MELIRRGKIKLSKKAQKKYQEYMPQSKTCVFCGFENGLAESICAQCKRPLDREVIERQTRDRDKELDQLRVEMLRINKILTAIQNEQKLSN